MATLLLDLLSRDPVPPPPLRLCLVVFFFPPVSLPARPPPPQSYNDHGGHCGFFAGPISRGGINYMGAELCRFLTHARDTWAARQSK